MTTPTTERVVRFVMDVAIDAGCSHRWALREGVNPLMALADAGQDDPVSHAEGWNYFCPTHRTTFGVSRACPAAKTVFKAGMVASIPSRLAESLERIGQVVYPTHTPEPDATVQATLDKSNKLMEAMGFPRMDADSIQAIRAKPKRVQFEGTRDYYATSSPATHRLAADLGLSTEDILQMKKAGRTAPDR